MTQTYVSVVLPTSVTPNHLLTGSDCAQYGFFKSCFHILRLFKCQAIDPLQSLLPLQRPPNIRGQINHKKVAYKLGKFTQKFL